MAPSMGQTWDPAWSRLSALHRPIWAPLGTTTASPIWGAHSFPVSLLQVAATLRASQMANHLKVERYTNATLKRLRGYPLCGPYWRAPPREVLMVGPIGGPPWWTPLEGPLGGPCWWAPRPYWWALLVGPIGGPYWWALLVGLIGLPYVGGPFPPSMLPCFLLSGFHSASMSSCSKMLAASKVAVRMLAAPRGPCRGPMCWPIGANQRWALQRAMKGLQGSQRLK